MTDQPTPNVDALRETMDAVLAHQDQWDQACWIREGDPCGTSYCFAGWRAALDGYTQEDRNRRYEGRALNAAGQPVRVRDHAQKRLGLTYDQAEELFHADNTLAILKEIVDELCDGQP